MLFRSGVRLDFVAAQQVIVTFIEAVGFSVVAEVTDVHWLRVFGVDVGDWVSGRVNPIEDVRGTSVKFLFANGFHGKGTLGWLQFCQPLDHVLSEVWLNHLYHLPTASGHLLRNLRG